MAGRSPYAEKVIADGASAYWRLNEASGTTAADAVGTAHGTIGGGVTLAQPGALAEGSTAMRFDGATGDITVATGSYVAWGTGPAAIECWFKTGTLHGAWLVDTKSAGDGFRGIGLWIDPSDIGRVIGSFGDGTTNYFMPIAFVPYADNAWHHVVLVLERSPDRLRLYVDGTLRQTDTPPSGVNITPTCPTRFGTHSFNGGSGLRFNGVLDEIAIYKTALSASQVAEHYALRAALLILPPVTLQPSLDVQLEPGTWTDLTPDVIASAGVRATRGISGSGPMDRVAMPGILSFTLRNDAGNSGHTLGWYSPDYVGVRPGWTAGIPVRLSLIYDETPYRIWTGRIRTIQPEPGKLLSRYVEVTCQDAIADLTEAQVRDIPPQINQSEGDLITAVIATLPASAQPPLALDPGLDELPYVFDDIGDGAPALQLLTDVMDSTFGTLFVSPTGTLVYRNRQALSQETPHEAWGDTDLVNDGGLTLQSGLASVYNRVRATVHPRTLGGSATVVLFAITGVISVPAGGTTTLWGTYTDPGNVNRLVGGTDFQVPLVATTDYAANHLPTGGGSDMTGDLSIVTNAFASGVEFVITNTNGGLAAYLVTAAGVPHLQLRGRPVYDNAPVTVESVSAQPYGDRLLAVDLKYQDDAAVAQDFVDFIQHLYNTPSRRVVRIGINPQQSATHLLAAIERQIGEVLTVSETVTGLETVPVVIRGIEWEIQAGRPSHARVWWTVAPALLAGSQRWLLDDAVQSILDETTVLSWG